MNQVALKFAPGGEEGEGDLQGMSVWSCQNFSKERQGFMLFLLKYQYFSFIGSLSLMHTLLETET